MPDTAEPMTVPTGRFEWERIVRRIRMSKPLKLCALVLATYADPDGSRVRPGMEVLAAVTGDSEKNARRILGQLRDMRLVEQVARGGGRGGKGKASEFRLTVPTDLLERFELLGPGDRPDSPDPQMSGENDSEAVDNSGDSPDSPDTQMSAQSDVDNSNDRTSDSVTKRMTGHFQRMTGHPDVRLPPTSPTTTRPTPVVTTRGESRPRARDPEPRQPPTTPAAGRRAA